MFDACIHSEVNLDIIDKYVEHLQKEGVTGVYSKCFRPKRKYSMHMTFVYSPLPGTPLALHAYDLCV